MTSTVNLPRINFRSVWDTSSFISSPALIPLEGYSPFSYLDTFLISKILDLCGNFAVTSIVCKSWSLAYPLYLTRLKVGITDDLFTSVSLTKKLVNLSLDHCNLITENTLEYIGTCTQLVTLCLSSCRNLSASGLKYIENLGFLRNLDLSFCSWMNDEGLESISKLSSLRKLNLYRCLDLSDKGLVHLSFLPSLSRLTVGCNFGDEGSSAVMMCSRITDLSVKYLERVTTLETLVLGGTAITDEGLKYICSLTNLETLFLNECIEISDNGFSELIFLTKLKSLNLSGIPVTNRTLYNIGNWYSSLHTLIIGGCTMFDLDGFSHLPKLKNTLKGLSLGRMNVANRVCSSFATDEIVIQCIAPLEKLTNLQLNCERITDRGICSLVNLVQLEELTLEMCTQITQKSYKFIGTTFPNLQHLQFHNACISNAELSFVTNLKKLNCIHLHYIEKVTDEGLFLVSNLSTLSSIQLNFGYVISEEGIVMALKTLPNLLHIVLFDFPHLSDNGVRQILLSIPKLKILELGYCDLVSEDATSLPQQLEYYSSNLLTYYTA